MTLEIGFLFAVLVVMTVLFLTEKLPIDLTAFLGLVVLTLTGYLSPDEAFTGFGSSAVITMLSIFVVSGGILHTGLADAVGARVHGLVGGKEVPLIVTIMLVAGVLSAFINNIAAAAVMMPAVASIASRAGLSPSRLFMPLAFGAILGGTTTMVGTPPNILAAELLQERGLEPFELFEFTPVGLLLLGVGILFMITFGRRLLPTRPSNDPLSSKQDLAQVYKLQERLFFLRIPKKSKLHGKTLREARLPVTLHVQVISILRNGRRHLAPDPDTALRVGDLLLAEGSLTDVEELMRVQGIEIEPVRPDDLPRPKRGVSGIRASVTEDSSVAGKTLKELSFRGRYGVVVAGIQRGEEILKGRLAETRLNVGDDILALGTREQLDELTADPNFDVREVGLGAVKQLLEHVFLVRVDEQSPLVGTTIGSARIGELVGVLVGGIIREGGTRLLFAPDEIIQAGDRFLVTGDPARVVALLQLGKIELDKEIGKPSIESEEIGIVEAIVAPRSACEGKTLAELTFRDRFGLRVIAMWRDGKPLRTRLAGIALRFGDALLLQGPRKKIQQLANDRDFVVLTSVAQQVPRRKEKAPFALGGLMLMVAMVVLGLQPIHVAAFSVATLIVLSGAITMQEAYRAIEWRAIFLVAAVLPVGLAMERTGAAHLLSDSVTAIAGPFGPYAVLGAIVLMSSLLSQGLDGAPAVVLLTPVALESAYRLGISPYPIMMGVSLAASAAFMTPFSHKANLLVMGAGGYRAMDYVRVGTPLTIILLLLLTFVIPILFPFN